MTEWQPIATAPKDGTEVLLYAPGRKTYGAWVEPSPEPEWEDFEPYWASWDGGFTDENPPTHWMPVPEGPANAELCFCGTNNTCIALIVVPQ